MSTFGGLDFYNLDELFSEDEIAVRETVREWVDARVLPTIEQHY